MPALRITPADPAASRTRHAAKDNFSIPYRRRTVILRVLTGQGPDPRRVCPSRDITELKGRTRGRQAWLKASTPARHQQILDPLHYLATLGRRPAALDHSKVYRDWRLPAEFGELRQSLEQRHGPLGSGRQYIRVLQLLAQHPIERVQRAIRSCRSSEALGVDRIIQQTFRLAERDAGSETPCDRVDQTDPVMTVQVRMPDLRHFDQLLKGLSLERCYGLAIRFV